MCARKPNLRKSDFFTVWLLLVSLISLSLLVLDAFKSVPAVIGATFLTGGIFLYFRSRNYFRPGDNGEWRRTHGGLVLLLILLAVFFRTNPSLYIFGGQDQGIYVNMAAHFDRKGTVFPVDETRRALASKKDVSLYDKNNLRQIGIERENEIEGRFLPGVYVKNLERSENVFQFYHLFSLWMAIFRGFFGETNMVVALVAFGVISIVFMYLLAYRLSRSRLVSFLAASLLAVNPLHIYFSQFPVAEIPTLCFSLGGFYYLVRYFSDTENGKAGCKGDLILSAGLFGCLFATRVSGFTYIPFFYVMLISVQFISIISLRRYLFFYLMGIFALFSLSVAYGMTFSYPYTESIFDSSFSRVFGEDWHLFLGVTIGILILLPVVIGYSLRKSDSLRDAGERIYAVSLKILPVLLIASILASLSYFMIVGFTDKYLDDPYLSHWNIPGRGIATLNYSSVVVAGMYISPFLALAFVYMLFKRQNVPGFFLLVFLLGFWASLSFFQRDIPHQYYFARYVLSEVVPYTILFTVMGLGAALKRKNYFSWILIAGSAVYSVAYSFHLLEGPVLRGGYSGVKELIRPIGANDTILWDLDSIGPGESMRTTLIYFEGKTLIAYSGKEEMGRHVADFERHRGDFFIISSEEKNDPIFEYVEETVFLYWIMDNVQRPPIKFIPMHGRLHVYRLRMGEWRKDFLETHGSFAVTAKAGYGFWPDRWTKKKSGFTNLRIPLKGRKYLELETAGIRPGTSMNNSKSPGVILNGRRLRFLKQEDTSYHYMLPSGIQSARRIDIISDTWKPIDHNFTPDTRELGYILRFIHFRSDQLN